MFFSCFFICKCHLQSMKMPPNKRKYRYISRKQRNNVRKKRRLRLYIFFMILQMQMVTREVWIHPLNLDRQSKGEFYNLYLDQWHFPDRFFEHYRMTPQQFDEILHKIAPLIKKNDTNFCKAITPEEKLSLTLR